MDELLSERRSPGPRAPARRRRRRAGEGPVELRAVRLDLGDQLVDGIAACRFASRTLIVSRTEHFCEPVHAGARGETLNWKTSCTRFDAGFAKRRARRSRRHARRIRSASLITRPLAGRSASREQRAEGLRFDELSPASLAVDGEREAQFGEDATCIWRPRAFARAPQACEVRPEPAASGCRRASRPRAGSDCAVPAILLQPAGDVEESGVAQPVEPPWPKAMALPASRPSSHSEAQVLAPLRPCSVKPVSSLHEQRDIGVPRARTVRADRAPAQAAA